MSIPMSDIYTIMHYLKEAKLDRVYPVNIQELSSFQGTDGVFRLNNNSFLGVDTVEFVLRVLTDDDSLNGTTGTFEVSCEFCIDEDGEIPRFELPPIEVDLTYGEKSVVSFTLHENWEPTDNSDNISGVKSIKLKFKDEVYRCKVQEVIFRSKDFSYTFEDIVQSYKDGENYVKDKLNDSRIARRIDEIPKELHRYVLMCAGAYGWLIIWENESKPMKEPKSESNNYADRLFGRVDDGIESYLKTMLRDYDSEFINTKICRSVDLHWGLMR